MTEKDAVKVLMVMQATYPNFKVQDKETAIKVWTSIFPDMDGETVLKGLQAYIMNDQSGFAPAPGQVRGMVMAMSPSNELGDSEAWALVYRAVQNGIYGANKEFNALPADIRRALGGPGQLTEWARMDEESLTVAESNFKRTYRSILESNRKMQMLPENMRPLLTDAPVAALEDKHTESEEGEYACPDWVSNIIANWEERD